MFALLYRLLLIFFAVSVLRSVIRAIMQALRGSGGQPGPAASRQHPAAPAGEASESTLLHQDPVCGTYVAAAGSLRKISKGKVYHFCSEDCRNRFNA